MHLHPPCPAPALPLPSQDLILLGAPPSEYGRGKAPSSGCTFWVSVFSPSLWILCWKTKSGRYPSPPVRAHTTRAPVGEGTPLPQLSEHSLQAESFKIYRDASVGRGAAGGPGIRNGSTRTFSVPGTVSVLEQQALLMPENSRKPRRAESCKFLGCRAVKYFTGERHGKCVLLGKVPTQRGELRATRAQAQTFFP